MTLSRSKPLRADRSHDWREVGGNSGGWTVVKCTRCETERTVAPGQEPPAKWCNGFKRSSLDRGSGPKPVNAERRRRRRVDGDTEVRHTYGAYHRWIKTRPCLIRRHEDHECDLGPSGHHVKHVGNGGKDPANEVALCRKAHDELHRVGRETWEDRYDASLREAKWKAWDLYRQTRPAHARKLAGYTPNRPGDV